MLVNISFIILLCIFIMSSFLVLLDFENVCGSVELLKMFWHSHEENYYYINGSKSRKQYKFKQIS